MVTRGESVSRDGGVADPTPRPKGWSPGVPQTRIAALFLLHLSIGYRSYRNEGSFRLLYQGDEATVFRLTGHVRRLRRIKTHPQAAASLLDARPPGTYRHIRLLIDRRRHRGVARGCIDPPRIQHRHHRHQQAGRPAGPASMKQPLIHTRHWRTSFNRRRFRALPIYCRFTFAFLLSTPKLHTLLPYWFSVLD